MDTYILKMINLLLCKSLLPLILKFCGFILVICSIRDSRDLLPVHFIEKYHKLFVIGDSPMDQNNGLTQREY